MPDMANWSSLLLSGTKLAVKLIGYYPLVAAGKRKGVQAFADALTEQGVPPDYVRRLTKVYRDLVRFERIGQQLQEMSAQKGREA